MYSPNCSAPLFIDSLKTFTIPLRNFNIFLTEISLDIEKDYCTEYKSFICINIISRNDWSRDRFYLPFFFF